MQFEFSVIVLSAEPFSDNSSCMMYVVRQGNISDEVTKCKLAEIRVTRWICGVKLKDGLNYIGLTQ